MVHRERSDALYTIMIDGDFFKDYYGSNVFIDFLL